MNPNKSCPYTKCGRIKTFIENEKIYKDLPQVVTIFAEVTEAAPADYQRIIRAFFMPETVNSAEAEVTVKKTR